MWRFSSRWFFVVGDAKMGRYRADEKRRRAFGGLCRASGVIGSMRGFSWFDPLGRAGWKQKPRRRAGARQSERVVQKGTTTIITSSRHTWPMVITAGSIERVRCVFMVKGLFWLLLFVVDGAKLRVCCDPIRSDRAAGGLAHISGRNGSRGREVRGGPGGR